MSSGNPSGAVTAPRVPRIRPDADAAELARRIRRGHRGLASRTRADAVVDAWRALFFLVPVVSSTFASFDRVFRGLGAESLGWLLIDEAGQATPQNPVGAIWRARRAVVVGDPIQLEPVVTLPFRAQQAVRRTFGVSEQWLPARGSAQSLADRLNRWGTTLSDGEEPIWVGAPLRVRRRCDDPMFTIVNTIAYDGTMLHGRDPRPSGPLQSSRWMHVTGPSSGHYVRAEHDLLVQQLNSLRDSGHDMSEVIVITPFRQVASRLVALERQYPGLSAGTVHRAQGKEADVVFFVLGGDPSKAAVRRARTRTGPSRVGTGPDRAWSRNAGEAARATVRWRGRAAVAVGTESGPDPSRPPPDTGSGLRR